MFQRIGATIEGIAKALEKGMSMKDKGEEVFEERKAVLLETEKKMNDIKERLIQIRREISA
jgi:hypothetical protein